MLFYDKAHLKLHTAMQILKTFSKHHTPKQSDQSISLSQECPLSPLMKLLILSLVLEELNGAIRQEKAKYTEQEN